MKSRFYIVPVSLFTCTRYTCIQYKCTFYLFEDYPSSLVSSYEMILCISVKLSSFQRVVAYRSTNVCVFTSHGNCYPW